MYFWERERETETETETETEHEWGKGRERGRHRIQSRLQVLSCQHRDQWGLQPTNHEIRTWAEVGHLTNWATQVPWDEEKFLNNSEPWAHASDLCDGVGVHACVGWGCKIKKKKEMASLVYCVYIYTFKNMMLKVILVEQNTVISATLKASWQ